MEEPDHGAHGGRDDRGRARHAEAVRDVRLVAQREVVVAELDMLLHAVGVEGLHAGLEQADAAVVAELRDAAREVGHVFVGVVVEHGRQDLEAGRFVERDLGAVVAEHECDGLAEVAVGGVADERGTGVCFFSNDHVYALSVDSEQIASIDFFRDIFQVFIPAIRENDVALFLELVQVADDAAVEEGNLLHARFVDDQLNAFSLQAFHDALNGGLPEIVGAGLHREPVNPHDLGIHVQDLFGDEVLSGAVCRNDGRDDVLRNVVVVCQELFRILRQAISAVSVGGVVVVVSDSGIQADALDDRPGIQPADGSIGVKLVEETHAQSQIGIGKKLHRLGLGRIHDADFDVFLERRGLQQMREGFGGFVQAGVADRSPDDDPARVQIVIQRPSLAKEFRAEQDIVAAVFLADALRETDRDRALDDHDRVGIHGNDLLNDGLDARRVKVVELRIVVGRGGDDDKLRILIGAVSVGRGF